MSVMPSEIGAKRREASDPLIPKRLLTTDLLPHCIAPGKLAGTPSGVRVKWKRASGGVTSLNHRLHAGIPPG